MSTPNATSAVSAAAERLAVPVFVFGVVFASAMASLLFLASPDRFPVRIGDKVVKVQELSDEEAALNKKQASLLSERKQLDDEVPTPVQAEVARLRGQGSDVGRAFRAVEEIRKSFALSGDNPITIDRFWYGREEHRLAIAGQVRDPAGRSLHILASFVDNLRSSGSFDKVSEPEYAQSPSADGVVTSPFNISLTLPHGG